MAGRFSVEAQFKAVDRLTAPVSRMQNRMSKFTRGMEKGLRRVNRQVNKAIKGFAKFGKRAAVGSAAAAAGLILTINKVAESADALAKRARRLDFPIKELQEWQFVAEQSGFSTDEFDKSIEKFTKTVGEAKSGTGTLITILKKSNPQLLKQITNTKDVSKAFELYLNAIRKTEDQTVKTALATAAFGRQGAKLLNITGQSSSAIAALRKEQLENGVITAQQAAKAEAYNDAMSSLNKTLKGFLFDVILPLLPKLTEVIRKAREWAVANKKLISKKVISFIKNLIKNFDRYIDTALRIGKFIALIGGLILALNLLVGVMKVVNIIMAMNPIGLIIVAIGLLITAIALLITYWDEIKAKLISFGQVVIDKVISVFEWLKETFTSLSGRIKAAIVIIKGPIGWLIAAAKLVMDSWQPIKGFFGSLWDNVKNGFLEALKFITNITDKVISKAAAIIDTIKSIGSGVASFFGFDDDEAEERELKKITPQVVSPNERIARSIEEQRTINTAEVTIRDETGRAEVTNGNLGQGLALQNAGAF